jgi:hypothetical protein
LPGRTSFLVVRIKSGIKRRAERREHSLVLVRGGTMFMFPLVSPAATTVGSCEVELGPMRAAKPCR